jgi:hypothetical protein
MQSQAIYGQINMGHIKKAVQLVLGQVAKTKISNYFTAAP